MFFEFWFIKDTYGPQKMGIFTDFYNNFNTLCFGGYWVQSKLYKLNKHSIKQNQ